MSQTAPAVDPAASLPGLQAKGEVADYTVFQVDGQLFLLPELATDWFLEEFPEAAPVPGTRIIYPDGSEQIADQKGDVDLSQSAYAAGDVEDRSSVLISVVPPAQSGLPTLEEEVAVPTAEQEADMVAGFIPPDLMPEQPAVAGRVADVRQQGYIWSSDGRDYMASGRSQYAGGQPYARWVGPTQTVPFETRYNKATNFEILVFNRAIWLTPHANFTGTDQAVPGDQLLLFAKYAYSPGFVEEPIIWYISALKEPNDPVFDRTAAIWLSPNAYFFAENIHLALLRF